MNLDMDAFLNAKRLIEEEFGQSWIDRVVVSSKYAVQEHILKVEAMDKNNLIIHANDWRQLKSQLGETTYTAETEHLYPSVAGIPVVEDDELAREIIEEIQMSVWREMQVLLEDIYYPWR